MYKHLQRRTFEVIEKGDSSDWLSRVVDAFLATLIVANITGMCLATMQQVHSTLNTIILDIDKIALYVFTAEYLLRLWSCTTEPPYERAILGRLRFARTPMLLIDMAAILPFWISAGIAAGLIPAFISADTQHALLLLRILRIIKIARYFESVRTLGNVISSKHEELSIAALAEVILLIVSSSLLYFVEHDLQPEKFSSIPAAMWWGMSTLTTVGYGDIIPISPFGKFLAMAISLIGITMFAVPMGILGSGFVEEMERKRAGHAPCPSCQENIPRHR
ncbi:potassium channel protein [Candidatus Poribacteria bacterium]|nr:potassium channel protein [Candidatus Poribacteria bacterium]